MKCADALLLLLEADLAALSAHHASPLGEHVKNCARCRAVVVTLQANTSDLATLAVAHPAPATRVKRTERRRAIWLAPIPLAAVAVLAYLGLSRVPSRVATSAVPSAPVATAPDAAAALPAARVARRHSRRYVNPAARQRPSEGAEAVDVVFGRRSTPTRIDVGGPTLATSVAPTLVAYHADFTGAEIVSVDVSTLGGRVVVLRPSNSNITVVWFY